MALLALACVSLAHASARAEDAPGAPGALESLPEELPPLPPPTPPPAATPVEDPPAPPRTGVVTVDPRLRRIVVDGEYVAVVEGTVTLACGRHAVLARDDVDLRVEIPGAKRSTWQVQRRREEIAAELRRAESVDVPCDDVVALAPREDSLRDRGVAGRFQAGYGHRVNGAVGVSGVDLVGSLGGRLGRMSVYGDVLFFYAEVPGGRLQIVRVGPSVDIEISRRVRLGGGAGFGGTSGASGSAASTYERRASGATPLGLGLRLFASVDLLRAGTHAALYVAAQVSGDTSEAWGPAVALGGRF